MIAIVQGEVLTRQDDCVLIMTDGGTGYEIRVGAKQVYTGRVRIFTWNVFNEGTHEDILYGFATPEARELAKLSAETDGVGPGKAHKFVNGAGSLMILRAVQSGDISELLANVKGLGPKTLKAILVTLKAKGSFENQFGDPRVSPVRMALSGLGIAVMEMDETMDRILKQNPGAPADVIVRLLLASLPKK